MRLLASVASAVAACVIGTGVSAQGTGCNAESTGALRDQCVAQRNAALRANAAGGVSSVLRSPAAALELQTKTDTKAKTASASVGWVARALKGSTIGATLGFEGPLAEDPDEVSTVGSLTKMAEGTRLSAGLSYYRWNATVDVAGIEAACAEIFAEHKKAADPKFKEIEKVNGDWCFRGSDLLTSRDNERLAGKVKPLGIPVAAALRLEAGRQEFKWVDADNAADSARKEASLSVAASFAVYSFDDGSLLTVTVEHARGVKPGKSAQVCKPLAATPSTTCKTTAVGAPKVTDTQVLSIAVRRLVTTDVMLGLGYAYDVKEKEFELSLPLYFLRSANGLSGGVAGRWTTSKTLALTVFVGGSASTAVSSILP